ncbi:MAG: alpha/beta hydrolase-fold protein [Saprospiraceae bacterium]
MRYLILPALISTFLFFSCNKNNDKPIPTIIYGKSIYNIEVEGKQREYLVHVPASYDGKTDFPVVIMLHGTSGDGAKMYNGSGWVQLSETENFLAVFPSSLKPCIIVDGEVKSITKWNSQPAEWQYCPNEFQPNDILFLNKMLDEIEEDFKVDKKRIYLEGFSNGGQMASKCSIFLSERLAAIVANASGFSVDTTFIPHRKLPMTFQIGNMDWGPGVDGPSISLSLFDTVLVSRRVGVTVNTTINSFGLSPNYALSGDTSTAMIATYNPLDGSTYRNYNVVFVNGLGHSYPNGNNHWMYAAKLHWDWMQQFTLD